LAGIQNLFEIYLPIADEVFIYDNVQNMTLEDVKAFQEKYVKGRPYTYCILGDSKDLDLKSLGKIGKITKLTKEEIFGY